MTRSIDQRVDDLTGSLPDLAAVLQLIADNGAAIGQAAHHAHARASVERLGDVLDASIGLIRERLHLAMIWGVLLDVGGKARVVRHRWATPDIAPRFAAGLEQLFESLSLNAVDGSASSTRQLIDPHSGEVAPQLQPLAEALGLRAALAVPLFTRTLQRVVGGIIVGGYDTTLNARPFTQLLEIIGNQIGSAIGFTEAAEQLQSSEKRVRILAEEALDGIYMVDPDGYFTYANSQMEHLLGYSRDEIIGQHFRKFVTPENIPRMLEFQRQALAGQTFGQSYSLSVRTKSGETGVLEINARNVFDEQTGQLAARFGIARDVTSRRQLENDLAKRNQALELLNGLATLAGRGAGLDQLLAEALVCTRTVFDTDQGTIHLLDEARNEFVLAVQHGYSREQLVGLECLPADSALPAQARTLREPIVGERLTVPGVEICEGTGGFATVALRAHDRVVGLLTVVWPTSHLLSPAGRDTLAIIGAQLGSAIENAQLADEAQASRKNLAQRAGQLSRLLAVSAEFAANRPIDDLLNRVAQAIVETLHFGSAHVRIRNERGNALVGVGFCGYSPEQIAALRTPTPLDFYHRLLHPRFSHGGVQIIPHDIDRKAIFETDWTVVRHDLPSDWQPGRWHPEQALVVPLLAHNGALLGVIFVDEPLDGLLPDADKLAMLEIFGRQAALAIENVELYDRTQRDLRRQNSLREVIEHISGELDLDRLLEKILADAVDLLDGTAGAFSLVDPVTREIRIGTLNNLPLPILQAVMRVSQGLTQAIIADGQTVLINDNSAHDVSDSFPLHSYVGVPVRRGDELVGTFFVGSTDPVHRFGQDDVITLEFFAKHAALALDNAHLYEEARAQAARLRALQEGIEQIGSELDLAPLLNRIVVTAVDLFDADSGLIVLVGEEGQSARIEAGHNLPSGEVGRELISGEWLDDLIVAWREIGGAPDRSSTTTERDQARIAVPIWWQERLIGIFGLAVRGPGKRFSPADIETLALLARHVAVAIENAGLYTALQERLLQVEGIDAVGTLLVAERDLGRVLRTVAEQIMSLLEADGCAVMLMEDDEADRLPGAELERVIVLGVGMESLQGGRLPLHGSYTGDAIFARKSLVVEGLLQHTERIAHPLVAAGIDSLICTPLLTSDHVVGSLNAYGKPGKHFDQRDVEVMTLFARQAAVAIENARLYQRERSLAIAEERNRLAREIHDTLAQGFTGIIIQLGVAESLLEGEEPAARARLERASALARDSLHEARRSVWNLRPSTLQGRTLPEALRVYLADWTAHNAVATELTVIGEQRPLTPATEETLLRVTQEALTNVQRHAQAKRVDLLLNVETGRVSLRICDDGVGFVELTAVGSGGSFGLISMRERVARLGGDFDIETAVGQGTCVHVTLDDSGPLTRRALGSTPG